MSHFRCILQNDDNLCNEKSKCNIEDARSNIAWGYFKIGQSISSLSIVQFSPIFKLIIVTWISSQNLMKIEPDWSLSVKIKSSIITDFDRHSFIYLWGKLFTTFLEGINCKLTSIMIEKYYWFFEYFENWAFNDIFIVLALHETKFVCDWKLMFHLKHSTAIQIVVIYLGHWIPMI